MEEKQLQENILLIAEIWNLRRKEKKDEHLSLPPPKSIVYQDCLTKGQIALYTSKHITVSQQSTSLIHLMMVWE